MNRLKNFERFNISFLCPRYLCIGQSLHQNRRTLSNETIKTTNDLSKASSKPVWYYNNKAIRRRKISQLLRRATDEPNDVDETVLQTRRLIEVFKSYEFKDEDIHTIFYVKPKLLQLSKAKLRKRFFGFLTLDLPLDVVREMIIKCPGILLVKQEDLSLQKRLNHLQELSLQPRLTQDRCLYLIQKIPQILLIDTKSNLTEKIKNLQTLGFNDQQIFELVMKHPAILTYSVDNVKEKVTFISEKANGRLALLVKFPRVFTSSLVRLEERYHYLLQEGFLTEKSRFTENKLRALVLTKDSDFVYRVTNGRMKDYRQFQKDFQTDNKFDDFNEEEEEEEINDQFDFDDKEDIEISR